jgi:hypothetical protein
MVFSVVVGEPVYRQYRCLGQFATVCQVWGGRFASSLTLVKQGQCWGPAASVMQQPGTPLLDTMIRQLTRLQGRHFLLPMLASVSGAFPGRVGHGHRAMHGHVQTA